jgi:hypothetical protein
MIPCVIDLQRDGKLLGDSMNNSFGVANRMQQYRTVKAFEATYLRVGEGE